MAASPSCLAIPDATGASPLRSCVVVELELLVAGLDPRLVRDDPHLYEVHGLLVTGPAVDAPGVVLLGVADPGPGAHALGQPGVDHAVVADGVLVHERSVEHPGDDLHVAVRVGLEPGAGRDHVVVADEQQAMVGVGRVPVAAEREGVLRVEPADVGLRRGRRPGGRRWRVRRSCAGQRTPRPACSAGARLGHDLRSDRQHDRPGHRGPRAAVRPRPAGAGHRSPHRRVPGAPRSVGRTCCSCSWTTSAGATSAATAAASPSARRRRTSTGSRATACC